jgi:hypothetical protein
MTNFEFRIEPELPGRALLSVDKRFDIAIERTDEGLEIRVYPLTDGEIWFEPYDSFRVEEQAVIDLEKDMEA